MIVHATEPTAPEPAASLRLVSNPAATRRAEVVALYEAHFRSTARLAYLLCGNTQQADDLAHDAFVRMWEHWDKVDDPARRVAYLRTIVVNLANSAHRRAATARRHASAPALALVASSTSPEDEAMHRAARPDVMAALAELPDRQRSAIVLRHWLRMTEGEIAEALGCSVGSVRTHLARANTALARRLGGLR